MDAPLVFQRLRNTPELVGIADDEDCGDAAVLDFECGGLQKLAIYTQIGTLCSDPEDRITSNFLLIGYADEKNSVGVVDIVFHSGVR